MIKQVTRSKETKPRTRTKRKRSSKKKRNETVVMRSQVDYKTMKKMLELERLFTPGPSSECAHTRDIQTHTISISSYVNKESCSIQERVIESVANKIKITKAKETNKAWNKSKKRTPRTMKSLTSWSYYGKEGSLYPEGEKEESFYQDEFIHFQDKGYYYSRNSQAQLQCIQDRAGALARTAENSERKMVSDKYFQCSTTDSDLKKPQCKKTLVRMTERNEETKTAFDTFSPLGNDENRVGPFCSLVTVCSDPQKQPSHESELDNLENAISIKKLITVGKTKMQTKRSNNKPSALSIDDSASQAYLARDERPQQKAAKDKLDQCLVIKDMGCTYDGRQSKLPGRKLTPWQNNAARRGPDQRPQWTGRVQSRAAARCGQDMTGWESDATAVDSVDLNPLQHADGLVQCKNSLASYTYQDVHKIAMTGSCTPALSESVANQIWGSPRSLPSSCGSSIRLTPPPTMTDGERTFSDESTDRESSTSRTAIENGEENNVKSDNIINEDAEKHISHISPRKSFSSKHDMLEDFLLFYEDSRSNKDNAISANKTKDTHNERSEKEEGHAVGRGLSRGGVLGCDSKGTQSGIGQDETRRKDIGIRNSFEKQLVNGTGRLEAYLASEKQDGSENYNSQDESGYSTPVMGEHDSTATVECGGEGDRSLQARDYLSSHVNYNEHVGLQDDSHGADSPCPFKLKGSGDCTLARNNISARFVGEEARLSISRNSTPFSDRIVGDLLSDSELALETMVNIISKKPSYHRANAASTTTAPSYSKAMQYGAHTHMKRTGGRADCTTTNLWEYSKDPYPLSIVSSTSLSPARTFDLPVYFVPKVQPSDPIAQVTPTTARANSKKETVKRVGRDRAPEIPMHKPMIGFHKFDRGMSDVDNATGVSYSSSKPDEKLEFCNDLCEKSIVFLSKENQVIPPPFPKPCPQIPNFIPMKRQQTSGNLCKKTDAVKATGAQAKGNTNTTTAHTVVRARPSAPAKIKKNPLPSFIEKNIQSVISAHDTSKYLNQDRTILHLPQIHCFDDNGVKCGGNTGVGSRVKSYPYYQTCDNMPMIRRAIMLKSEKPLNGYDALSLITITAHRNMKTSVGSSLSLSNCEILKLPDIE